MIWLSFFGVFLLGLSIYPLFLPSLSLSGFWLLFILLVGLVFLLLNLESFNFLQQLCWILFGCREISLFMRLFSLIMLLFFTFLSSPLDSHYLARKTFDLHSLWTLPCTEFLKGNFDVAIRDNFDVAAAVISNSDG
jgi:hypothetical protein